MTDLTSDALQIAFHDVECATYDERFGIAYDRRGARDATREVTRLLRGDRFDRVLDVGCGTGYLGFGLLAEGRTRELHAVDISPGMLHRAQENAARLGLRPHLVRAGATALPYPDDSFDAVVSRGVLHHLEHPMTALREWRRVARDGAPVLVLSEPTPLADRVGGLAARAALKGLAGARKLAAGVGRPLSAHDPHSAEQHRFWDLVAMAANLHTFTPRQLAELGRSSGFGTVVVRGAGLMSIAWASAYYVLVGELPALAASEAAKRRAGRTWSALRRLDALVAERLLPPRALLTVQAVFSD